MSSLRRFLHVTAGWLLGVLVTLAWVWVGEGKVSSGPGNGGLYLVLTILTSIVSMLLLLGTLLQLAAFTLDGRQE